MVVKEDAEPRFATRAAAKQRFVTPFTSPRICRIFGTMNFLQHINRKFFALSQLNTSLLLALFPIPLTFKEAIRSFMISKLAYQHETTKVHLCSGTELITRYYVTRKLNIENYNRDAETKVASVTNNRRKQTT